MVFPVRRADSAFTQFANIEIYRAASVKMQNILWKILFLGHAGPAEVNADISTNWKHPFYAPVSDHLSLQLPIYPSDQEIGQINKEVLEAITVKKLDAHGILSLGSIKNSVHAMIDDEGDLYDKAASLLISLVRGHPFESGNRRTAYVAAMAFLKANSENPKIVQDESILLGIRANFYSKAEIKAWLRGNEIRKFSR